MNRIQQVQSFLCTNKIESFLLPNNDEFQNEYLPERNKRIEWLTDFTGSAATIIITQQECVFFTDGRYILQAQQELDLKWINTIYDLKKYTPWQWLRDNNIEELWYDPSLHTNMKKYADIKLYELNLNPIDTLWDDRPKFVQSPIKNYETYSGKSSIKKCQDLADKIPLFITSPDSVCWLLNIRGNDIRYTPLVLCYAILHPDAKVDLFLHDQVKIEIGNHVTVHMMDMLPIILSELSKVSVDSNKTAMSLLKLLPNHSIISKNDPCQLAKACKNSVEIEGTKKAHIRDGIAMTEFLYWMSNNQCTEKSAADKSLMLREEQPLFQELSFPVISAFAEHAAIIHYTKSDDTLITGDNFYLIDSGGQYLDGTTDVTRTIPIGNISDEQKYYYTLVLKGHIALAQAIFPQGTSGRQLDVLARQYLWSSYADYNHGSGHGVGSYLSVHEGPHSTSNDIPLQIGMIISNEPGFYKDGQYGIRIENLMHVISMGKGYLGFTILTYVPIDVSAVNVALLNTDEINWINNYNSIVCNTINSKLQNKTREWLAKNGNSFIISKTN